MGINIFLQVLIHFEQLSLLALAKLASQGLTASVLGVVYNLQNYVQNTLKPLRNRCTDTNTPIFNWKKQEIG